MLQEKQYQSQSMSLLYQNAPIMDQLSDRLNKNFNIDHIFYARCYENQWLFMSTNPEFTGNVVNDKNYRPAPMVKKHSGICGWARFIDPVLLKKMRQAYPGGASVMVSVFDDFSESISLASSHDKGAVDKIFTNKSMQIDLMFHIRESIQDVTKNASKYTIEYPQEYYVARPEARVESDELDLITYDKAILIGLNGEGALTKNELHAFIGILNLKTAKEMARALNVTAKTVEYYIGAIKNKLGILKRSDFYKVAKINGMVC